MFRRGGAAALAAAVLALAAQWGAARANHLSDDSQIVTEHGRISLLKGVAELALSNLNEVEKPEEPYVFGRMIEVSQDTAVQHRYKSVIPRGLGVVIHYEAIQNTMKRTAVCTAEVSLSLTSDFSINSNKCEFYVKAGNSAGKESPTEMGVKQDTSIQMVRSAGGAVGSKYHFLTTVKDADTVYVCTARQAPASYGNIDGVSFFITTSISANCEDILEFSEVFRNPIGEYIIIEPEVPPIDISVGLKFGIAVICAVIWVALYIYHIHLVKKDIKLKIWEKSEAERKAAAKEAKKNEVQAANSTRTPDQSNSGKSD